MKVTITIYGLVKVTTEYNEIKTETLYFATEDLRDEMLTFLSADFECGVYSFEYEEEIDV